MDKYLLEILQESNTIIIPGLGALTVTNKETGETMFMPYLQHDDGKLASFISEKDGVDEADAKNIVAKYVREIQAELNKGEPYSIFGLGEFIKADDGDIEYSHASNSQLATKPDEETAAVTEVPVEEEVEALITAPELIDETPTETEGAEEEVETPTESTDDDIASQEPVVVADEPVVESEVESTTEDIENAPEEVEPVAESVEEDFPVDETPETPEAVIPEETHIESTFISEPEVISESEEELNNPEIDIKNSDLTNEEVHVKEAIKEALENTPEPEEIVAPILSKKVVAPEVKPEPIAAMGGIISEEPLVDENSDNGEGENEVKQKEKPSARFWITMITLSIVIIGGGAYIGRNYNELKQHVPFLADDIEKDSLDTVDYKNQKLKSANDNSREYTPKTETSELDESTDENGMTDETSTPENVEKPKVVEKPKTVEKPKVVERPKVTVSPSSGGHYHIIAGAFSSIDNANRLVDQYKKQGLSGASVIKNGNLNAVSMQSYATSEQARADLSKMNGIASGAWILYK